jgi:Holliday junction resolvase RusA-like endonuclease
MKTTSKRNPWITVPVKPLSANDAYAPKAIKKGRFHVGTIYKTTNYQKFERKLIPILPDLNIPEDSSMCLHVHVGYSNKLSDLDNALKPFIDVLQKRYLFNDKLIYKIIAKKQVVSKGDEFIKFRLDTEENMKPYITHKRFPDRPLTKSIVVHEVDVSGKLNVEALLWHLETKAREQAVIGHGVHYLVLPDGSVIRDRAEGSTGCLARDYDRVAIYIRVALVEGEINSIQAAALDDLTDTLQVRYEANFYSLAGWGAIDD